MIKYKFYTINLLLVIVLSTKIHSQKQIETQQLFWMRYNLSLKFNEDYKLRYEVEERLYHSPFRQHQFVNKVHLERGINKSWFAGIGFSHVVQSLPQNPQSEVTETQMELRPQIEIENKQKLLEKLFISHRYWTEFRFFEQPDNTYDFSNVRMRYKLELNYNLTEKITLKAFDEIHINVGNQVVHNVFDQNRYGGSFQLMPSRDLGFELGYINWFQQKKTGIDFYNRNIVRFTIHQNINMKKQTKTS